MRQLPIPRALHVELPSQKCRSDSPGLHPGAAAAGAGAQAPGGVGGRPEQFL